MKGKRETRGRANAYSGKAARKKGREGWRECGWVTEEALQNNGF